jgi:hypothetical protein
MRQRDLRSRSVNKRAKQGEDQTLETLKESWHVLDAATEVTITVHVIVTFAFYS